MAGAKPDLEIPLTINGAQALAILKKMGETGKQAGDEVAEGVKKADTSVEGLTRSLFETNLGMKAMEIGKGVLDGLAQATVSASQDLKRLAEDFIRLRDRARELAGILGVPGGTKFTAEQEQFAVDTGMTSDETVTYRNAFEGEANQYKDRFLPGEYEKFQKEAAKYGNQMALPPDIMAKLAGTAVRTGPMKGQTSEGMMQLLGQSFKTLQAGSGDNPILAGQLARMSGLIGPGEAYKDLPTAATAIRMGAETDQSDAFMKATEMRQGVVELATDKDDEKAKELGITPETTNFDAIKKLSEAQEKSGENIDVFLNKIFKQQRVSRAFKDGIKAYRNKVLLKGMEDAASIHAGDIEKGSAAYLADPEGGLLKKRQAETAQAESRLAEERVTIATVLEEAKTATTATRMNPRAKAFAGLMDSAPFTWLKGAAGQGYQGFEPLEYATAYKMARQQAQDAGVDMSKAPSVGSVMPSQPSMTHAIAELVNLTREANKHRQELVEHQKAVMPKAPPLGPRPQPQPAGPAGRNP